MKDNRPTGRHIWRPFALAALGAFALLCIANIFTGSKDIATPVYAQSDLLLERRINQMEQRFYMIESRLSRVEQFASTPQITSALNSSRNDAEISAIRSQIDVLRLRIAELECATLKIDERTLAPANRLMRSGTRPGTSDICRQNPGTPVMLSARP